MKLLVLVPTFPDETNTYIGNIFVKEQVRELSKLSEIEEINVVVGVPWGAERKRRVKYSNYTISETAKVHFVRYPNPAIPMSWYFSRARKLWLWLESKALAKYIEKENIKFDLIHAHYSWPSGAVAVKLKERYNVPVVITEHTHVSLYPLLEKRDPIIIDTWKKTDVIIRVNKRDIPKFKQIVPSAKFVHIPNGYNPDRIEPIERKYARKVLNISPDIKVLFNLAGLHPYKGHKYLIDAMSLVVKERNDVVCYIGGSGTLRDRLKKQIKELGLQEHVKLLGFVPDEQLKYWMNAADLFVLPSLSEGNPTVMFEALGVGLPFVGTAVGGVPEIITSEDYGLLCPPANPECLAEKILKALDKEWDREKIRKYAEQFTWDNIAQKILSVYKEVL